MGQAYGGPAARPSAAGIWIGAILMVVGVIGGMVLVVAGFVHLATSLDETPTMPVPGTHTFRLEPGEYLLYGSDSGTVTSDVTVKDPSGQTLPLGPVTGLQTQTSNGKSRVAFASFNAASSGAYEVTVVDPTETFAPTADLAVTQSTFALVGVTFALVFGGFGLGGLLFVIGMIVLIVALVRRSRAKRAVAAPPMGWR